MSRAPDRASGHAGSASGLQALADLINDVMASWGTQPAPAGAGWVMNAIETPATRRPSPVRARASRALDAVPDLPATPAVGESDLDRTGTPDAGADDDDRELPVLDAGRSASIDADHAALIDADHVETWRLVHLAQDGDGEAFGMLYDRYVDSVFRFIYYRVNDRALAEDFTSETFVRALRRIGTISYQGRDIGAWFVTIARNIVLDHVKSARHRLESTTGETIEHKEHAQSTEAAVLESLASEQLMHAVGLLGEEQRECVMLRFMQGLSVSETAAVMGKNDGAIKALQHRAVRKLADLLGDDLR